MSQHSATNVAAQLVLHERRHRLVRRGAFHPVNAHAIFWFGAAMLASSGCYTSSAVLTRADAFTPESDAGVDARSADATTSPDARVARPGVGLGASTCPVGLIHCDGVVDDGSRLHTRSSALDA